MNNLWQKQKIINGGIIVLVGLMMIFGTAQAGEVLSNNPRENLDGKISSTGIMNDSFYEHSGDGFMVEIGDKSLNDEKIVKFQAESVVENKSTLTKVKEFFVGKPKYNINFSLVDAIDSSNLDSFNDSYTSSNNDGAIDNITNKLNTARDSKNTDNKLIITNVLNDIGLQYQALNNGLKENIVVNGGNGSVYDTYIFELDLENGVEVKSASEGEYNLPDGTYYFVDASGNYIAHILKPVAFDSNGNKTEDIELIFYDNLLALKVSVDWLADPILQYPIYIDPTIVHDTQGEFNNGTALNRIEVTSDPKVQIASNGNDDYTKLLLHMDGAQGSTFYQDDSSSNHTITSNNGAYQSTYPKFGDTSGYFDNSNDYLSITDSDDFYFDGDFTIDFWVYWNSLPGVGDYDILSAQYEGSNDRMILYWDNRDLGGGNQYRGLSWAWADNNVWTDINEGSDKAQNWQSGKWYHIAAVRDGGNVYLFRNGDMIASGTEGVSYKNYSGVYNIGYGPNEGRYLGGFIDEYRISKGIARWTSDFTPPGRQYEYYDYGVYTSEVLDLTVGAPIYNDLTWTEHGVRTGDGETDLSINGLVAKWNFNETSGTTVSDSSGNGHNGTATNMTTTGQDNSANSGWTANNRKWGAGAIMFDGSNDYVSLAYDSDLAPTSSISFGGWFKTNNNTETQKILSKTESGGYHLSLNENSACGSNTMCALVNVGSTYYAATIPASDIKNDVWYHAFGTYDGETLKLYINGNLVASNSSPSGDIYYLYNNSFCIGGEPSSTTCITGDDFNGVIDSTRIYSRALESDEINSLYQAGNVQLQTRSGADSTPDDGSWEEWRPVSGSETQINNFDNPYLYNTTDTNLVSYWPLNETSGTNVDDPVGSNDGTATGTTIVDGKYSKARNFNGSSDYVSAPDSADWDFGTGNFSIGFWMKIPTDTTNQAIIGNRHASGGDNNWNLQFHTTTNRLEWHTTLTIVGNSSRTVEVGKWNYVVLTRTAGVDKFYINGINTSSFADTFDYNNGQTLNIGKDAPAYTGFFNGQLDEIEIFNSDMSAATVYQKYLEGIERLGIEPCLIQDTDSDINIEGSASQKITTGAAKVDANTVGLWHLDETNGDLAGTDVNDSSGFSQNGEFSGTNIATNVAMGFKQKSRDFNGSDDYIEIADSSYNSFGNATTDSPFSVQAWVYRDGDNQDSIISKDSGAGAREWQLVAWNDGYIYWALYDNDGANRISRRVSNASSVLSTKEWHLITATYDGSSSSSGLKVYVDGVQVDNSSDDSGTYVAMHDTSAPLRFGNSNLGASFFNGKIDEVKISNIELTADEIYESYRAGRDYRIQKTLDSAVNLNTNDLVPFYIASDQPGTHAEVMFGESEFANYMPDTNTLALWHFEEESGSGAYIKDSSSNGYNFTPNGSASSIYDGKIGKGVYFTTGDDYLVTASDANLYLGSTWSIDMWLKPSTYNGTYNTLFTQGSGLGGWLQIFLDGSGRVKISTSDQAEQTWTEQSIPLNSWTHLAISNESGTNGCKVYINGRLLSGKTITYTPYTSPIQIGWDGVSGRDYSGYIDEYRIQKGDYLTAEEIRQIYEIDKRTHPITIDFAASLDSGNLITGSGDTSFTVDATTKGLPNMGSSLYPGDKIIVRENYNGTEYIAQGTITTITASTGVANVGSWDAGSTFPTSGFTADADVFKWQQEYFDISDALDSHVDAVDNITLRVLDGDRGRTFWLDDLNMVSNYLTDPTGSTITSTGQRYFQYRLIETTTDADPTPSVSSVTLDYSEDLILVGASTSESYLNNNNKTNFNIQCNDVTYPNTATVYCEASWNQSDWYEVDQTTSPISNVEMEGYLDVTSWNGYPADGNVTMYVRGRSGSTNSDIRSFTIDKDTVNPTVDSITSIAGDDTAPYYDPTDDGNTLVEFSSTGASACKWDESDLTYTSMANSCSSTSECTLDLTGFATKNVSIGCIDTAGNYTSDTTNLDFSYTIGGVAMTGASTSQSYLNNHNKNAFNIQCNGVTSGQTGNTITCQASFDNSTWHTVNTIASPISDVTIQDSENVTLWSDYPADGDHTMYVRAFDGTSYSNTRTFSISKDTVTPTITSVDSVAGDATPPYEDPTNNSSTYVDFTGSSDISACRYNTSDTTYDNMTYNCNDTTGCPLGLEGQGAHTAFIRCIDGHDNKMSSSIQVDYTITGDTQQPTGWRYTRVIELDQPTTVANSVIDFGIYSDIFDYDKANANGSDIRIYDEYDRDLDYYIEYWNSNSQQSRNLYSNGTSRIWVKIPQIGTDKLYMYYGNNEATAKSDVNSLFYKDYTGDASGLVALYHFDEGSSATTLRDDSGNGHTGTFIGNRTWYPYEGPPIGGENFTFDTGAHIYSDGNDRIDIADDSELDMTSAITLETWVNFSGIGTWDRIIEKPHTSCSAPYHMYSLLTDDANHVYITIPGVGSAMTTSTLSNNNWYHIIGTYDSVAGEMKIYLNGVLENTSTGLSGAIATNDQPLTIGGGYVCNDYVNGYIDESRIYDRAISEDEVKEHYYHQKLLDPYSITTTFGNERLTEEESYNGQNNWLDSNWAYRAKMTVTNPSNSVLTDFQVPAYFDSKTLFEAGKMQADGDDLRFTTADGLTEIPYWIESNINEINTSAWVKLPEIKKSTKTNFYVYYGNLDTNLDTTANGEDVFIFFDDFEDGVIDSNKWTKQNLGSYITETGGELVVTGVDGLDYYIETDEFDPYIAPIVIESRTRSNSLPTNGWSPFMWYAVNGGDRFGLSVLETSSNGGHQYYRVSEMDFGDAGDRPVEEWHYDRGYVIKQNRAYTESVFEQSMDRSWLATFGYTSLDRVYLKIGPRHDTQDTGLETFDGRVDSIFIRKFYPYDDIITTDYTPTYTIKTGTIGSETWDGNINIVDRLTIAPGETLTINQGTVIKFTDGGYIIADDASIIAEGTAALPIYFTSFNDDTIGDINDDTTGVPNAGDWNGIYAIGNGAGTFKHCIVKYGGAEYTYDGHTYKGMINSKDVDITVQNTQFFNSENADIYVYSADPIIERNNLGDSPYGLYIEADNSVVANPVQYNSFANTTIAALYIDDLPDTDNNTGPGLVMRHNDIDDTNTGFYIQNPSGSSVRDSNAENTIDALKNAFENTAGFMCYYEVSGGNCKFDRTSGGEILYDTNSVIVNNPNSLTTYFASETETITWDFNNGTSNGDHIDIMLSTNSGEEFDQTIVANLKCDGSGTGPGCTGIDGEYDFSVPAVSTSEARIKVSMKDAANNVLVEDISDLNFTITVLYDELTDSTTNNNSIHTIKFVYPQGRGSYTDGSVKFTFADEFDLSVTADNVVASGGDVVWSSGEIVDQHSITFPFSGTLDSSDGLITIVAGDTNNGIDNPIESGTYMVTLTFHDNLSGLDPYSDRFSTNVVVTDGVEFEIDVESALEFSIRDIGDSTDIDSLSFGQIESNIAYDRSHIFKVSTNAYHGYTVTLHEESDLTNASVGMNDFIGTNTLPLAWQSPPGAGVESYYGYHTNDASLGTGTSNRFSIADRWAAIISTPQEVAYNDKLIQKDTTTMTYRLEVTDNQATGYYEHIVQYICLPKY